ncbi:MAG: hypothetical protein GC184_07880 [Rhizobiales bacterium]|nr:hypothetical protein [Hyphomicrobiales bacterium]
MRAVLIAITAVGVVLAAPSFAESPVAGPRSIVPPGVEVPQTPSAVPGAEGVVDGDAMPALDAAPSAPMTLYPTGKAEAAVPTSREISAVPGGSSGGIVMGTLGTVDMSSTGLIDSQQGSLGADMWDGATRADIDQYLANMPVATSSPVMSDLARRLLLTGAEPPPGAAGGPSMLATRLNRLIAAGDVPHALELANNGSRDRTPSVAIEHARAALAATKPDEACAMLSDIPPGNDPAHDEVAAFSIKLSAFCQIRADNKPVAMLTVDLAREEGLDDPLFYSLAGQAIDGIKLKAADPAELSIMDASYYRLAERELPADAASIAAPALLLWLARDESLSAETRILAGERAVMLRLMTGQELVDLYKLPPFTQVDFDGLQTAQFPASAAMRRALLYQATLAEAVPETRINLIRLAFSTGEAGHLYFATVQAYLPVMTSIAPSMAMKDLAPAAVRAYLLIGDEPRAESWFKLMSQGGGIGRNARELGAIMGLSAPEGSQDMDAIANDIRADLSSGESRIRSFAMTEAMLRDALGQTLPGDIWQTIVDVSPTVTGRMPAQVVLTQLDVASRRGVVGETVMLAIDALGADGVEDIHPRAVAQVVASLRAVHLDSEARRLATEALLARSRAGRG